MHKSILVLLVLLLAQVHTQVCTLPGLPTNDLIQTDTNIINNRYSNARLNSFNIALRFNPGSNQVQSVASASSFSFNTLSGLDMAIRVTRISSTQLTVVLLLTQNNNWVSIRISVFTTARSDFFVGHFSSGIYVEANSQTAITLRHRIVGWQASQEQYNAVAQFTGLRTLSNSFTVSFFGVTFDRNSGELTVRVSLTSITVEFVEIGYIVAQVGPYSFSSFNPASPPASGFQWVGLERLSVSGQAFQGSNFIATGAGPNVGIVCIGGNCPSSCILVQRCSLLGGLINGNTCFLCLAGQSVVSGACQTASPCGANEIFTNGVCVCISGYLRVNEICYISCGPNAYVFQNNCVCIPGFTFSNQLDRCVANNQCPPNYTFSNNQCLCLSPFGLIGSECLVCPANSFVDGLGNCRCNTGFTLNFNTRTCQLNDPCGPNQSLNAQGICVCDPGYTRQGSSCVLVNPTCTGGRIFNGITCVCPQGQNWNGIQCVTCQANASWNGNQCVCNSGYFLSGNVCVLNCPANSQWNGNQCVCNGGFVFSNGACVPNTPNCPANSAWNGVQCVCNTGFTLSGGVCVPVCPANSAWNGATCVCNTGFFLFGNACIPNCQANASWNGIACVCNTGYFPSGNTCVLNCPANSAWNGVQCVCNTGFTLSGGVCVQNCPANSALVGGVCTCNSGFRLIGGVCVVCDPNSTFSAATGTCTCNPGFFGTFQQCTACHGSCATCSGAANNQCITCADGRTVNNGVCTGNCPSGFFVNATNGCSPCLANCALCFLATTCTSCKPGFSLNLEAVGGTILMTCVAPPTGSSSIISLNSLVVGNAVVFQGATMSLIPAAILTDGCVICNDLLRVNAVSQVFTPTVTVQYVTDSQYWFIIIFDFAGALFVPDFQFSVQINPIYAAYFSETDMTQKLTRVYTQSTAPFVRSAPILLSARDNTPAFSQSVTNAQLATLFAK